MPHKNFCFVYLTCRLLVGRGRFVGFFANSKEKKNCKLCQFWFIVSIKNAGAQQFVLILLAVGFCCIVFFNFIYLLLCTLLLKTFWSRRPPPVRLLGQCRSLLFPLLYLVYCCCLIMLKSACVHSIRTIVVLWINKNNKKKYTSQPYN